MLLYHFHVFFVDNQLMRMLTFCLRHEAQYHVCSSYMHISYPNNKILVLKSTGNITKSTRDCVFHKLAEPTKSVSGFTNLSGPTLLSYVLCHNCSHSHRMAASHSILTFGWRLVVHWTSHCAPKYLYVDACEGPECFPS